MPLQARGGPYPVTSWDFVEALPAEKAARYASPPRWLDDSRFRSRGHASTSWYLHCPYLKSPTPDHLLSADNLTIADGSGRKLLDRRADMTAREMVVDDAAGLHGRIEGRRADEPEARPLQSLREGGRLRGRGEPVGGRDGYRVHRGRPSPEELVQRDVVAQGDRRSGVRDRGLDLAAMTDDARIAEQTADIALAETGDDVGVEARETCTERLALPQDRQPRETGLEPLEAEALVDPLLGSDGSPPLVVVVGVVGRVGALPAANDERYATSTLTIPSSTRTG